MNLCSNRPDQAEPVASLVVGRQPWLGLDYSVAISYKPGIIEEYSGVELMSVVN